MRISKLIQIVIPLIALSMLTLFSVFFFTSKNSERHVKEIVDKNLQMLNLLQEMQSNGLQTIAAVRYLIITHGDEKTKKTIDDYYQKFLIANNEAMKLASLSTQEKLNSVVTLWQEAKLKLEEIQNAVKSMNNEKI
ncbi:MAG: hypothetical protein NZ826_00725 [Thermodesulfovibrio sp.]|nr:hypothetical protein [Thermodesulfovibrio sp.]